MSLLLFLQYRSCLDVCNFLIIFIKSLVAEHMAQEADPSGVENHRFNQFCKVLLRLLIGFYISQQKTYTQITI